MKAGGEGDDRGQSGRIVSPTQWTWVWASSGGWWRTGKAGLLQSMGSQRVRHDWATEQQPWWDAVISLTPLTPYKTAFIRSHPFLQISEHCLLKELSLTPQTNLSPMCPFNATPFSSWSVFYRKGSARLPFRYKRYGGRDSVSHLPPYVPRS